MKEWARTANGRDMLLPTRASGASAIVSDPATCAKIKITSEFEMVQGEWFLDVNLGFPWIPIWQQRSPNLTALRFLFRKKLLTRVARVDDLNLQYTAATGHVAYAFRAFLSGGEAVSVP